MDIARLVLTGLMADRQAEFRAMLRPALRWRGLALAGALTILLACSLWPSTHRAEPGTIVVRNASGVHVAEVTLLGDRARSGELVRYGRLSPVPVGASQVVGRRTDPPPLGDRVELRWRESSGREWSAPADLSVALRHARGGRDEALVFELLPRGGLSVSVERTGLPRR